VSLIGSLEQFKLSTILQRIEAYTKTGLLTVKQEEKWVEFSFRQGQLMCIGPVRSNITLGERLLQAGVISQQAFQEAMYSLGEYRKSETRTAITLIDLGYVNQESLYTWAAKEASKVLQALLTWSKGEIYFEEDAQPPADRLLIALSIASLLLQQATRSTSQPTGAGVSTTAQQEQPGLRTHSPAVPDPPTLYDASQFFDSASSSMASAFFSSQAPAPEPVRHTEGLPYSAVPLSPPQRVAEPVVPMRIDTSFMQPQMVLVPTDLSAFREQNPRVSLTPEQWRVFTRADGQTSLQMACQELVMPRELVCQVAGELIALGLVTIFMPSSHGPANEASLTTQDVMNIGYSGSLRATSTPAGDKGSNFSSAAPVETLSQWGNGGNGATFVLGGGWVVTSSLPRAVQSSGPLNLNKKVYAPAGSSR
jgi:hypothetical protein